MLLVDKIKQMGRDAFNNNAPRSSNPFTYSQFPADEEAWYSGWDTAEFYRRVLNSKKEPREVDTSQGTN